MEFLLVGAGPIPVPGRASVYSFWCRPLSTSHMSRLVDSTKRRRLLYRTWRKTRLTVVRLLSPVLAQRTYMRHLVSLLREHGMQIDGEPIYISARAWFDGTDYSLIRIEDKVVISSHVSVLTHDFSLARARDAIEGRSVLPEVAVVSPVRIGRNSFIGRSAILMPGADVGCNCIVGAGSVVRGSVPDCSIVVGNPAVVVGNSLEWGRRKLNEFGLLALD